MKSYENKEDLLKDFISTLNDLDSESDKTCSLRCNECRFKTRDNECSVNVLFNIYAHIIKEI